jgi:Tol biopolymer transport system component
MKNNLSICHQAFLFTLACGFAISSMALPLQFASGIDAAATPPAGGGGDSWHPIITPDGRYVLFASRANNLVMSGTNNPFLNQMPPKLNVFLRDRTNGTTTLVSVNFSGTGPGNGDSIPTALSTNGQFALFESAASDILPGDTNNATDIFLRDLVNGTNQLISVSTNGRFGNGASWESVMTPDGRCVAFASAANNLVLADLNGIQDIFVRDTQAGVTTLASPGALSGSSDAPAITPDGQYVVFRSTATNLVYRSAAIVNEIYVRDLVAGVTTLASTNAHNLFTGTPNSYNQIISDDGLFVAFESSLSLTGVIQRYNLLRGLTDILYTNAVATYACNHFRSLDMTPDGRFITFVGNTAPGGTNSSVFVWDALSGVATLASTNLSGAVPTNSVCDSPTIDPSGRWLAYFCTATNLTTNGVSGDFHLYLQDLQAGTITLVDAGTNGAGLAKDFLSAPRLTPDGRFLAFDGTDADLTANDNNRAADVFVADWVAGTNELISVRQPALPSQTPAGATLGPVYSVNSNGRYVAFSGTGIGLLPNGYTNAYRGVFVRDQLNGTNILVSVDTNGLGGADGWSFEPSISGDGRYVAFTSGADNLVRNDSNIAQDVFLRDLQTGITALVSVNTAGTGLGNGASYSPTISTDGRYVLFHSLAKNLASGSFNGSENIFLRDLQGRTNYALTTTGVSAVAMTPDARFVAFAPIAPFTIVVWNSQTASAIYAKSTTSKVTALAISPDGNRIVYSISGGSYAQDRAANSNWLIGSSLVITNKGAQFTADSRFLIYATTAAQVTSDTNGVADVYLYDFQTRSNLLVSQSDLWPGTANGPSDSPTISADGRFIAYRSSASDLVAGATNGLPNVFVFDRQMSNTTLVSVSAFGNFAGNNRSFAPAFSGDSQTLVFPSWASDLAAQNFNQSANLFSLGIYPAIAALPFIGQLIFVPASGQKPVLSWPAVAGKNYQVQYKDNLTDLTWQNMNGSVTVVSNRASTCDLAPNPGHRFYRITSN